MSDFTDHWPRGLSEEVAVVDASIENIEAKLSVSFEDSYDDLDRYRYCIFRFDRGLCALMRYDHAQISGVTLIVEKEHLADVDSYICYFLDQLHLSDCRILWRRP